MKLHKSNSKGKKKKLERNEKEVESLISLWPLFVVVSNAKHHYIIVKTNKKSSSKNYL